MGKAKIYSFDDHPEHKAQLGPWRDRWIANALNCKPMDEAERTRAGAAVDGLYRAAGLSPPDRTLFVGSPLVGAVAASVASGAWWIRENPDEAARLFGHTISDPELMRAVAVAAATCIGRCLRSLRGDPVPPMPATRDATYDATRDATYDATDDATHAATHAATRDATHAATRDATSDATHAATRAATSDATHAATHDATHAATHAATRDATHAATRDATSDATNAATRDATSDATHAATHDATRAATHAATRDATHAATSDATNAATNAATRDATNAATRDATSDATRAATHAATSDAVVRFLVGCSIYWWRLWNGGNMWSGWVSYLTFFRHVAKIQIDYSKFVHYEALATAGPRFMHRRFCIISDRPEFIHRDSTNRPHRIDGPHIRWRDGVELHHIHGVRVPPKVTAGDFTAQDCLNQPNAEVRRVMIQRYNAGDSGRWVRDIGAAPIHEDLDQMGRTRRLYQIEQPGDEPYTLIEVINSTPEPDGSHKTYQFRCSPVMRPHADRGACHRDPQPQELNCQNAIASTYGYYGFEYYPQVET